MAQITNFREAHQALLPYAKATPAVHEAYSLERMRALMAALGNPQEELTIIHVAGTSGKTSTCYYVAAMLRATGKNIGLTVSPHLDEVNERLQINGSPLAEAAYCQALEEFLRLIANISVEPTYFELLVAMAYWYFAREKVDYSVIEVGLGGLLDSTNVITRPEKVCVITDIGLDHEHILGSNLVAIAGQKAGIIQPGNEVFCFKQNREVDTVIERQARAAKAVLHDLNYQDLPSEVPQLPRFQRRNWQLAAHIFEYVRQRDGLPELSVQTWQQSQATYIPGRMEVITYKDKTIILDGAHNPQKMQALVSSLTEVYSPQPMAALVAFKNGKAVKETVHELERVVSFMVATQFRAGNDALHAGVPAAVVAATITVPHESSDNLPTGVAMLLARTESVLVITGSIYVLHQVRELLPKD